MVDGAAIYTKYLPHISANDMNDFKFLIQIYPKYNEILKPRIDNEEFDKFSASKQVCVLRARKKGIRTQRIAQYITNFFPTFLSPAVSAADRKKSGLSAGAACHGYFTLSDVIAIRRGAIVRREQSRFHVALK